MSLDLDVLCAVLHHEDEEATLACLESLDGIPHLLVEELRIRRIPAEEITRGEQPLPQGLHPGIHFAGFQCCPRPNLRPAPGAPYGTVSLQGLLEAHVETDPRCQTFHRCHEILARDDACQGSRRIVRGETPGEIPRGIELRRVPVRDFDHDDLQRHLPECVRVLRELIDDGHTVYVHCTAGIGRSPSVVVAYLHWVEHQRLQEAFDHVNSCRPCSPDLQAIRLASRDFKD